MSEPGSRRGRTHDAEGTREAILNAAEGVFAQHGFDGARIDAIAAAAGYNKSLIFQYFGDKLSLYAEVIRRADDQTRGIQTQALAALLENEVPSDAQKLKAAIKTFIRAYFDYLVEHPRIMRIYIWEMAEGWQTYAKIVSQRDFEDIDQFGPLLQKIQIVGLLRPDINPIIQVSTAVFSCMYYLALIPIFQIILPNEDLSSPAALASSREYITEFISQGLMTEASRLKS